MRAHTEPPEEEYISKTQVKKDMLVLQKLGERLTGMSPAVIRKMDLPEAVKIAAIDAKPLKRNAFRRQIRMLGSLLREVDSEEFRQMVNEVIEMGHVETDRGTELDYWREKLMSGGKQALTEFLEQYPHAEIQQLRQLLRNAQKEQAAEKPGKSVKALKRYLREIPQED